MQSSIRRFCSNAFSYPIVGLAALLLAGLVPASAQVIVTIAGRNAPPAADGTPALQVPFQSGFPAIDSRGNLLVPDMDGHVVYRMTPLGSSEVVAGSGFPGFSGDGGDATKASLNAPSGAWEGPDGSLYITEFSGHRVRKVDPNGIISTLAGNGFGGFFGDGVDSRQAQVSRPGPGTMTPEGDIIFSDSGNNLVRKISRSGIITTVAGNPAGGPFGAEGIPATQATLNWPVGLAYDTTGNLLIADRFNQVIRSVTPGGNIRTFAGSPNSPGFIDNVPASRALLYEPMQMARDPLGRLVFLDKLNFRIRRIDNQNAVSTIAGTGAIGYSNDGSPPLQTVLDAPEGMTVDGSNRVYIAEERRIRRFSGSSANQPVETVAGLGRAVFPSNGSPALTADIKLPQGVTVDNQGRVIVASTEAHTIFRVNLDGSTTRLAGNGIRGYTGDGGPAVHALLWAPRGMTVAEDDSILFCDTNNNVVRRIAPDGTITTIAGNGVGTPPVEGAPATQSGMQFPHDVAIHPITGEIYISVTFHHMIFRIDGQGILRRVAGTGVLGFDGDGPALEKMLNYPKFMDFDSSGNLYIADDFNHRIRRISPNGLITTLAGTGEFTSLGDGGPATQASLRSPWGVAVAANGDIYVSEANGHVVRKFAPGGIISTVAGVRDPGLTGDGGPAVEARLNNPSDLAIDQAGNILIPDRFNNRIRAILTQAPAFDVTFDTSGPLQFEAEAGKSAPAEPVSLQASVLGLRYDATVSDDWLIVDPPAGDIPEVLNVRADASSLQPGEYTGRVTLSAPDANPPSRSVEVRFSVAAGDPAALGVDPSFLTFGLIQGGRTGTTRLQVRNEGAGSLNFNATATSEQGWLSIDVAGGTAAAGEPAEIEVTADPSGLSVGTYVGDVIVTDDSGVSIRTPVTMSVSEAGPVLTLSHAGLSYRAQAGGGRPAAQTVGILNTGTGRMRWNASAQTLSGGPRWLRLDKTSGEVSRPFQDVSILGISIDPAGLSAGEYFGRVDVTSPGNPPETISVLLTVQPAGQPLPPEVSPSALIFTGAPGMNPGAQELSIVNLGNRAISYASSTNSIAGESGWFAHSPEGAVVAPNQPQRVLVNPNFNNAQSGILRGSISFQFDDGTVRNVRVLGIVASDAASLNEELTMQNACPPLQMELASSGNRIQTRIGEPVNLGVKLHDSCGRALDGNTPGVKVLASFTNGDPQMQMRYEGDAAWGGSWQPRSQQPQNLTVTVTGLLGFSVAQQDIAVEVQAASPLPVVEPGAVRNAASFEPGNRVSPGGLISIFGRQLANTDGAIGGVPFPTVLEDTEIVLAGVPLPLLFAANGQVNAQVPFDLPLNRQVQLLVKRGNALSVEERLTVAPAQPAVFTLNQQGFGQAAIVDGLTFALADRNAPASPGGVLTAFATGLGAVNPPAPAGDVAPDSPLSVTVNPVQVFVDGIEAEVLFNGLAPRFAGLYQVNFFVPQGVTPGDAVPVVLRQAGLNSPPVTIVVR